jgi:hypothetical protein
MSPRLNPRKVHHAENRLRLVVVRFMVLFLLSYFEGNVFYLYSNVSDLRLQAWCHATNGGFFQFSTRELNTNPPLPSGRFRNSISSIHLARRNPSPTIMVAAL